MKEFMQILSKEFLYGLLKQKSMGDFLSKPIKAFLEDFLEKLLRVPLAKISKELLEVILMRPMKYVLNTIKRNPRKTFQKEKSWRIFLRKSRACLSKVPKLISE